MKYFKHDLLSRDDDKIFELIEAHGMQGYGIWWAILEELYKAEDSGFQIEASDTWFKRLSKELNLTDWRTLIRLLDTMAEQKLIDAQLWADHVICAPGITKRADDYVRQKEQAAERKRQQRERDRQARDLVKKTSRVTDAGQAESHTSVTTNTDLDLDPNSESESYSDSNQSFGSGEGFRQAQYAPSVVKSDRLFSPEPWGSYSDPDPEFGQWVIDNHLKRVNPYKEMPKVEMGHFKDWLRKAKYSEERRDTALAKYAQYQESAGSKQTTQSLDQQLAAELDRLNLGNALPLEWEIKTGKKLMSFLDQSAKAEYLQWLRSQTEVAA